MLKKIFFFVFLISCCFIYISCDKKVQTSETDTSKTIGSITPIPSSIDVATSNDSIESNPDIVTVTPDASTESETLGLDSETEEFLYGTWQVDKLLCFADSYNDASEYPTGQKVIGDKIIIKKDQFDSRGLENYEAYQYITRDPSYEIISTTYDADSFYRVSHINLPGLNNDDEVRWMLIYLSPLHSSNAIPLTFYIVNNDKLILVLEATCFEMKKVVD